ncbi:MAG: hypothetical protein K2H03_01390, partial [Muribaculaceae bacterium]|nr:hypothetical protein [Muribaculaceae bacterium]
VIEPFVPEALAGKRTLEAFPYRGARLNITVEGYGNRVAELIVNGKSLYPETGKVIPAKMLEKGGDIIVRLDNQPIPAMKLNTVPNIKAPLTPVVWLANNPALDGAGVPVNNQLEWNPIEYIAKYIVLKDGRPVAETRETSYAAVTPGEWQVIGVSDSGVQSFASEPRSNRPAMVVEFPDETAAMKSAELSYQPDAALSGFTGAGFVELDRSSAPLEVSVDIPEAGVYSLSLRYANGNGPVNTENKAAVRTLTLDGNKAGTLVMPHRGRGNWNDWGMSNQISLPLEKGRHTIGILYLPEDENMNIDTNHALIDHLRIERAE